jgi:NAD-dependent deacetylase
LTSTASPLDLPDRFAAELRAANRWLVLTGAGVSADSGVPTFREAQTGLWARYDPQQLATPGAYVDNPQLVWDWYCWRRELIAIAEPNPGHVALAAIAKLKPELRLVTQNVDGLHQRAGSTDVIEFHGNIRHNRCFRCGRPAADVPAGSPGPPPCRHCGGLLRPDVVWFGEAIPPAALEAAFAAAANAEIYLSVGTSAVVYPAAGLAEVAAAAGATVVEINAAPTPLSASADHILAGTAAAWLPAIASALVEAVS